MDPNLKGVLTELQVQEALLSQGFNVSVPINPASRYDMIVDAYGHLFKVQSKTSKPVNNGDAFTFCTYSTNKLDGKYYKNLYGPDDVDLFATSYDGSVYIIPREMVEDRQTVTLRLNDTVNHQIRGIRYAKDYQLDNIVNQYILPYNGY